MMDHRLEHCRVEKVSKNNTEGGIWNVKINRQLSAANWC